MSKFDKRTFEKTMSEVMPGIKKMGLTLDSKKMTVKDDDRQYKVYILCKENNWYTMGFIEDYEYMLNNADVWSTEKIAMNIARHSHAKYEDILSKLKAKLNDSLKLDSLSRARHSNARKCYCVIYKK